jgi:hypothetical protein
MKLRREPVAIAGSIVGLIMAGVMWAATMGYVDLSPEQITATEQLVAIAIPLIVTGIATIAARAQVTPLNSPRDNDGEPLTRSDNSPAMRAM